MNYISFHNIFKEFPVFSIKDIQKKIPDFDNRRLVEWQEKNYLKKIRRGYYCLSEKKINEHFLFFTANKIYTPAYVSFESALAYYDFIPEGVFVINSATTRNTTEFETPIGNFIYRHLKPSLFFGYKLIQENGITIRIAEAEKVLLDFFYINTIDSISEIKELRFNILEIKEKVDFNKLEKYQRIFDSSVINRRINLFKKIINA